MDTYTALNIEDQHLASNLADDQLAALLDLHRREVVDAWIEQKHRLRHPRYQRQPAAQLRATTERQLSAVIEILATGPHALSARFLASICHVYDDADLVTTLNACLLLKEAAQPVIRRVYASDDAAWRGVARLDECLRWIVQQHVRHYEVAVNPHRQATDEHEVERAFSGSSVSEQIEPVGFHQSQFSLSALEERDRLAREMHDNLAQALGVLKLRLTLVRDLLEAGQIAQVHVNLQEMKGIAAEAYTDTREAIFNLRTPLATGEDFVESIRRYLARYQAAYGVDVQLICAEDTRADLSFEAATQAIRIVQEALTNVRKHAETNRAEVRIAQAERGLSIIVADNGRGFDALLPLHEGGYGLHVMQERAASVGGHLRVDAQVGQGVRVELWLPLPSGDCH